ncbi:MAG TPA: FliH/SctL family protein [Rhizomicrobium sp.]|jgi:flagellar assembly protein FliH
MNPRATATKFTFDTVFSAKDTVASDAAKARQKTAMTQSEIDAIRAEARAEGVNAGEVRAAEAVAAAASEAAGALRMVLQRSHADIEQVRAEAAKLALVAARTLARSALDALPFSEVEAVLRESLHQAIGEPRVVLRANPKVAEALQPRIAEIAHEEGYEGRVQISADPNIRGADCRIEWRGGGAERSEAALEAALAELIARRFSHIQHTPTEE